MAYSKNNISSSGDRKISIKKAILDERYVLLFVLVVTVTLLSFSFRHASFRGSPDEHYYLIYATYIDGHGIGSFPALSKEYLENTKLWSYPTPLRIGYILLSAFWLKISGPFLISLAYLSLICYCFFLMASFYFIRKYFTGKFAALFIILLAFSPLDMAMTTRALTENAYCLFLTLSLWLFLDCVKENSDLKRIIFILACSFTILIRENGVLLCLFFTLFLIFLKFIRKKQVRIKDFLCSSLFPIAVVFVFYAVFVGIGNAIKLITNIFLHSQPKTYAIFYGSGPWYRYLIDYLILSPATTILGIGFIVYYLCRYREEGREEVDYFILFFIFLLSALSFYHKNVRYAINLSVPFRIFSVLILGRISQKLSEKRAVLFLVGAVIAIAIWDFTNFSYLFVNLGMNDPVTFILLKARHIIN